MCLGSNSNVHNNWEYFFAIPSLDFVGISWYLWTIDLTFVKDRSFLLELELIEYFLIE